MSIKFHKHHRAFFCLTCLSVAAGIAALPFIVASCQTRPAPTDDSPALLKLREMTRGGLLPPESGAASIESQYPDTRAAALARIVRARVKMAANDFAGAAALLDASVFTRYTALGDYALFLRARALEQVGRRVEARAAYEKLARDFPSSLRTREAILRDAALAQQDGQAAAVPLLVRKLSDTDDPAALLLSAKADEQSGNAKHALDSYRRLYFYAPASGESFEAAASIVRLGSTTQPATADEILTRANKLYEAKRYAEAADAFSLALARFPNSVGTSAQLRYGVAALNARRAVEAINALNAATAGDTRAEALFFLAQAYAKARQWDGARRTVETLRREFPQSSFTRRAIVAAGQIAKDAKDGADEFYFFRLAVSSYPGAAEVTPAQFEIAWQTHEAKNYTESSRLLIEHLAEYADKNTDYRGRAAYWAGRDAERAGNLAVARAIYQALQLRYDANWYGYLAKERLDTLNRAPHGTQVTDFAPDSLVGRAIANLRTISVAQEEAGPSTDERSTKAEELTTVGLDDWAIDELNEALKSAPASPRLNLAKARIYRAHNKNLQAFNSLHESYPDYAQMKPEELTREEWDVFYPLAYWDTIRQQARARSLDPYTVAGLIRQESVFDPRAVSSAHAYGLMQLLVDTAQRVAQRYGIVRDINSATLFEPQLNIELGTAYLRDQLDRFGRIEYVAAAYNAGPQRAVRWRAELPADIDEWAEAIPFKETRGYVQGVVRNRLQYRRLYDETGQFRPTVGTQPVTLPVPGGQNPPAQPNTDVRPRRVSGEEEE